MARCELVRFAGSKQWWHEGIADRTDVLLAPRRKWATLRNANQVWDRASDGFETLACSRKARQRAQQLLSIWMFWRLEDRIDVTFLHHTTGVHDDHAIA